MRKLAPGLWIAAVCAAGAAVLRATPPLGDEKTHFEQIMRIASGDWRLSPFLSMLPGYHAVAALAARFADVASFAGMRLVTAGLGAASAAAFWWAARAVCGEDAAHKTARALVNPLVFPFFFLVYTDAFSLGLVAAAAGCAARRRDALAGLFAAAALLVRQTNVVWLVFVFMWIYLREEGLRFEPRALAAHAKRRFVFVLGLAAFAAFAVWNRGVSISSHDLTPTGHFSFGNVHMALFLFALTFLPELVRALPRLARAVRSKPVETAAIVLWAAGGFFLFNPDHPFNTPDLGFFWRNRVLEWIAELPAAKAAFFGSGALALAVIFSTPFLGTGIRTLFALSSFFCLWAQWLVEPRYAIVPFAFYVLYRQETASRAGRAAELIWSAALSAAALYLMSRSAFFP